MFRPKSKIVELAKSGAPPSEIAAAIRRSPSTARRRMAELGLNRPVGRPSTLSDELVETLYFKVKRDRVMSMDEAATEADVSIRTLQRRFKKFEKSRWRIKR